MLHKFDLLGFVSLTDAEKETINTQKTLKSRATLVAPVAKNCSDVDGCKVLPANFEQLGELAQQLLNDKQLDVSKVRPFFWSLVETYVDKFQLYPFDASKALFVSLELNNYPREQLRDLIRRLEVVYESKYAQTSELSEASSGWRQTEVDSGQPDSDQPDSSLQGLGEQDNESEQLKTSQLQNSVKYASQFSDR